MKSRIVVLVLCSLPGLAAAAPEQHRAAAASLTPADCSVEIGRLPAGSVIAPLGDSAIPRKTLRYSAKDPQVLGFNAWRFVSRRKEEESAWRPALREWGHLARCKVTQHGKLHVSRDLAPGGRFSLTPSTLGRNRDDDRGPPSNQGGISGQVGGFSLGELKVTTDPANLAVAASNFAAEPRPNFSGVRPTTETYPVFTLGLIALNKKPADPPVRAGRRLSGQRPAGQYLLVRFPLSGVQRVAGNCEKSRQ